MFKSCWEWPNLRERVRSLDIRRELRGEPLLLCLERRQVRLFRCLVKMLSRAFGGFSSTTNWEEIPGQTQNLLELLWLCTVCIWSGPGLPQDPSWGAGMGCLGEGHMEYPSKHTAPVTQPYKRRMDGFVDLDFSLWYQTYWYFPGYYIEVDWMPAKKNKKWQHRNVCDYSESATIYLFIYLLIFMW